MKLINILFTCLIIFFSTSSIAAQKYNCSELKYSADINKCNYANKGKNNNYDHTKLIKKNSSGSSANLKIGIKERGKKLGGSIINVNEKYKNWRKKFE